MWDVYLESYWFSKVTKNSHWIEPHIFSWQLNLFVCAGNHGQIWIQLASSLRQAKILIPHLDCRINRQPFAFSSLSRLFFFSNKKVNSTHFICSNLCVWPVLVPMVCHGWLIDSDCRHFFCRSFVNPWGYCYLRLCQIRPVISETTIMDSSI